MNKAMKNGKTKQNVKTNTKTQKSMEHSDMETLGFQLRDYYEEVE